MNTSSFNNDSRYCSLDFMENSVAGGSCHVKLFKAVKIVMTIADH